MDKSKSLTPGPWNPAWLCSKNWLRNWRVWFTLIALQIRYTIGAIDMGRHFVMSWTCPESFPLGRKTTFHCINSGGHWPFLSQLWRNWDKRIKASWGSAATCFAATPSTPVALSVIRMAVLFMSAHVILGREGGVWGLGKTSWYASAKSSHEVSWPGRPKMVAQQSRKASTTLVQAVKIVPSCVLTTNGPTACWETHRHAPEWVLTLAAQSCSFVFRVCSCIFCNLSLASLCPRPHACCFTACFSASGAQEWRNLFCSWLGKGRPLAATTLASASLRTHLRSRRSEAFCWGAIWWVDVFKVGMEPHFLSGGRGLRWWFKVNHFSISSVHVCHAADTLWSLAAHTWEDTATVCQDTCSSWGTVSIGFATWLNLHWCPQGLSIFMSKSTWMMPWSPSPGKLDLDLWAVMVRELQIASIPVVLVLWPATSRQLPFIRCKMSGPWPCLLLALQSMAMIQSAWPENAILSAMLWIPSNSVSWACL